MATFTVRVSAGATPMPWDDHAGEGVSRLNASVAHAPKYLKATVGAAVTARATVAGVEAPLDAALGGDLFTSDMGQAAVPVLTEGVPGQSSVQSFVPTAAGHYLWIIRRANGGAIGIHVDAE